MSIREWVLAVVLAGSAVSITIGANTISSAAGWVVGGILLAVWALLVLSDDGASE